MPPAVGDVWLWLHPARTAATINTEIRIAILFMKIPPYYTLFRKTGI
jgi:hypothetical protein